MVALFMVLLGDLPAMATSNDRLLQVIAIVFSISSLLIGFRLFKNKVLAIRHTTDLPIVKLGHYQTACIIWWALLEAPGLFALVCFILTGNYAFFALAIFHLLILGVFMPKKENLRVLLDIRDGDQ